MTDLILKKEPFSEALFKEIMPLGQKCWDESTQLKGKTCAFYGERDFAIKPDFPRYQLIASLGAMVIITLRCKGVLKGYVAGFTYRTLHHAAIVGAIGDSIYLEPDFRQYAGPMIDRFLKEMTEMKAGIIGWPVTPEGPVHKLLVARGFVGDDIVMEKRLNGEKRCA